jgi:hypothetical protein
MECAQDIADKLMRMEAAMLEVSIRIKRRVLAHYMMLILRF